MVFGLKYSEAKPMSIRAKHHRSKGVFEPMYFPNCQVECQIVRSSDNSAFAKLLVFRRVRSIKMQKLVTVAFNLKLSTSYQPPHFR